MIYAGNNSTIHATCQMSASGLVNTLGIRIIDGTGGIIRTRSTAGIVEAVAGSGFYVATIDLTTLTNPPAPGHYYVFWDDGAATPGHIATEDLYLCGVTTFATAIRTIQAHGNTQNAENIPVAFVVA